MYKDLPSIGSHLFYSIFIIVILFMLLIDILALNKKGSHQVSTKEALIWSLIWIFVSAVFGVSLYFSLLNNPLYTEQIARTKTLEFFSGYLIEKALAVDNIFVFLMIFSYFKIPEEYQRRVLLYGVFGAIALRVLLILTGAAVIKEFSWVLYLFGVFLIFTGIKMITYNKETVQDLSESFILRFLRRIFRVTSQLHGESFFILRDGIYFATPMFLVLLMIEFSDVIFAVDSIPAIFAVTNDPFVVMTSNIFAILGLRAMYFLFAKIANRFHFLKYGLAIVLIFIGLKMLIVDFYHIPVGVSLLFIFVVIVGSIIASVLV